MLTLPSHVAVTEVCPRDGLQSFPRAVDTDTKVKIVNRLSAVGFPTIEVTGFAHPRAIPNHADAEAVFARIDRAPGTIYRGLVPNARGAERAAAAHVDEMLGLIICSGSYLKRNQNMTIEKAFDEAVMAFKIAEKNNCRFVMALGMSFWCPYEGSIPEENVLDLIKRFRQAGIRRFYLAGSVGMEDPRHVNRLFTRAYDTISDIDLGFHVHNMSAMGPANILAALDAGATSIEGAICGIGGGIAMPAKLGSVGNYPTEDLVTMLELMGVSTGLNPHEVVQASKDISAMLEIEPRSHTANGITREQLRRAPHTAD